MATQTVTRRESSDGDQIPEHGQRKPMVLRPSPATVRLPSNPRVLSALPIRTTSAGGLAKKPPFFMAERSDTAVLGSHRLFRMKLSDWVEVSLENGGLFKPRDLRKRLQPVLG